MSGADWLDPDFWKGKRILLTGHTGFKGAWLALWLHRRGALVTGIGLPPNTEPSLFSLAGVDKCCDSHFCDIRDWDALAPLIRSARPEIVFHLAAQPLVRASYKEPRATFATNVLGTVHVLEALRGIDGLRVAVMVTTDKVYQNKEWAWPYRELDRLGGHDPYSASKAASEIAIASYRDALLSQDGVAVASARAGNVIGGGDWAEDRLIPDIVRSWQRDEIVEIRRPLAVRPWQHVLEPLAGYLALAHKLWQQPHLQGAFNFGPDPADTATVHDVVEMARKVHGSGRVHYSEDSTGPHEAGLLVLEAGKARAVLGIKPRLALCETVDQTMSWYRAQAEGKDARALCENEITKYEALC